MSTLTIAHSPSGAVLLKILVHEVLKMGYRYTGIPKGFLMFSGGIDKQHRAVLGYVNTRVPVRQWVLNALLHIPKY